MTDNLGRPRARRAHGDGGAALVEFALILPFLALMVFGTVDLGRSFQLKNRLTNAAREGAFYGQTHPCTGTAISTASIQAAVVSEDPTIASTPGFVVTPIIAGASCATPSGPPGHDLTVTVTSDMKVLTPFIGAITGSTIKVKGTATMVVQG